MINVKVDNDGNYDAIFVGTWQDITTEVIVALNSIYNSFRANDEGLAAMFRDGLTSMVNNPSSGIWKVREGKEEVK